MRRTELNSALDSIDFLVHWRHTPVWVKEVLRLFKRNLERQQ